MPPEALIGRLAHLCGLTETDAPISAKELIPGFSWDRVKKDDITME